MKTDNAIEVKNLSKQFSLVEDMNYGSLRDSIQQIFRNPRKLLQRDKNMFWALKDLNFEIKKGEVVGVIGRNGAGKSTLLKILSRITEPTTGQVDLKGRISSLLEVGTGFHPELTGKENIYLNGAILGMKKNEITRKFDEIVDFSGVSKFLDMPVKRYSTGMRVRLGFAVAAYLEPEILLVDEVLAVGDAEFQKKCLGKMDEISHESGRTILFVSHNMTSIAGLCNRSIYLDKGELKMIGDTSNVISNYLSDTSSESFAADLSNHNDRKGSGKVFLTGIRILDNNGKEVTGITSGQSVTFELDYDSKLSEKINNMVLSLSFMSSDGYMLSVASNKLTGETFSNMDPKGTIQCHFEKFPLNLGEFYVGTYIYAYNETTDHIESALKINVTHGNYFEAGTSINEDRQWVIVNQNWTKK